MWFCCSQHLIKAFLHLIKAFLRRSDTSRLTCVRKACHSVPRNHCQRSDAFVYENLTAVKHGQVLRHQKTSNAMCQKVTRSGKWRQNRNHKHIKQLLKATLSDGKKATADQTSRSMGLVHQRSPCFEDANLETNAKHFHVEYVRSVIIISNVFFFLLVLITHISHSRNAHRFVHSDSLYLSETELKVFLVQLVMWAILKSGCWN